MKTLIIVSGHCGTTKKVAQMLSTKIGNCDIFDTQEKNAKLDFETYDNFVFGSNIRMSMLNFRFSKWARRLKKYYKTKKVFGYLIGAGENNDSVLNKFSAKLQNNRGVVYARGEFPIDTSSKAIQQMYSDMINDSIQKGKELPQIKEGEIDKLAGLIATM